MGFLVLLVYVDNCLVAGDSLEEIVAIKKAIHDAFTIKDLGEVHFFLGYRDLLSYKGFSSQYALGI